MPSTTVLVSATVRTGGGAAFLGAVIGPALIVGFTRGGRIFLLSLLPITRIVCFGNGHVLVVRICLLYTSPSPRD